MSNETVAQRTYNRCMNENVANENVAVVFHGFLNLAPLEKLKLVEAINEYFDYPDERERIRADNEARLNGLQAAEAVFSCKCCSR